ncbi:hypothetical protein [Cyanobium sp. CH-040]|uniref:hypothetical protein n=1 Tax=Cyanobium sp. CH-040 TaxID=2823708 RepID=UPI0020CB9917|nr:hypothetical protein [Cyanobium sp. CH-040]MCP9927020.1 hypothetical protein [Cyanobium sp. CH-040]
MPRLLEEWRRRLARLLRGWAAALAPPSTSRLSLAPSLEPLTSALAACPATREPLSVEQAVLERSLGVLRREAADALAALGSAHALVSSARFSQLQEVRQRVAAGQLPQDALQTMAADYQGWQSDQVRLFDALALVLRMRIPQGTALEQVGEELEPQARQHLASLAAEYQRGLLAQQFRPAGEPGGAASDADG